MANESTLMQRVSAKTRKDARLLAALTDDKIINVIERAVATELKRVQDKTKQ